MTISEKELKEIRDELKWVTLKEPPSLNGVVNSKGIYSFLVPVGCFITAGVLAKGLHHLYKHNSQKQQLYMRYRVLSQGITVLLCVIGMFQYKFSSKAL